MSECDVSRLAPDDWAVFRDLRLRALADAPGAFGSRLADWEEATERQWRRRLEDVDLNLVARVDGEPVGMASGVLSGDGAEGDVAELISMWVDPAVRGRGVAGRLVAEVVAWASGRGRTTYLMVRSDNARALAAYERAGFVDLGLPAGQTGPAENRMVHRGTTAPATRADA